VVKVSRRDGLRVIKGSSSVKEEDRLGGASKGTGSNEAALKAGFLMRGYSGVPGGFRRGAARAIQAQRLQLDRGTAGPHGVYGEGFWAYGLNGA